MILAFERYYDVLLKNMKMLILQYVFNDFVWIHGFKKVR